MTDFLFNERDEFVDAETEAREDELGAEFGDPRRCPRHPSVKTSSNDGMHDAPCGECEAAMDASADEHWDGKGDVVAEVIHERDEDCAVGDDGCCVECGVFHDDPCAHCGGCGFHAAECEAMDDAGDAEQEAVEDEFARNGSP